MLGRKTANDRGWRIPDNPPRTYSTSLAIDRDYTGEEGGNHEWIFPMRGMITRLCRLRSVYTERVHYWLNEWKERPHQPSVDKRKDVVLYLVSVTQFMFILAIHNPFIRSMSSCNERTVYWWCINRGMDCCYLSRILVCLPRLLSSCSNRKRTEFNSSSGQN